MSLTRTQTQVLQDAALAVTTAVNGASPDLSYAVNAVFICTGTWAANTINFEVSYDGGTTYVALPVVNSSGSVVTTATSAGNFYTQRDFPLGMVRARLTDTGSQSGTVTVLLAYR